MTKILFKKTIPSTGFGYTGAQTPPTGTKILVEGISMDFNTKKSLIKFVLRKSKSRQTSDSGGEDVYGKVVDLKNINETIVIHCWLEDDATDTAWNKYWKLRAMVTVGGMIDYMKLKEEDFVIGDNEDSKEILEFKTSSTTGTGINIEELTGSIKSDDTGTINATENTGTARIEVAITIFLGDVR